ncbi:MAG: NYN domain-containing protein [Acidobacteria bacterium]|nr:NYN domain-containing protein [Acidobacteriota bacterium]
MDGFNVYHSLREASRDLSGTGTRWLDLRALLASYLPAIGGGATLESVHYFSALATHIDARKPGVSARHRSYITCLESTGVKVELGRFKSKDVHCRTCGTTTVHHEEKETDVAISVRLFDLFQRDAADKVVLVTGDTDLAPAVRLASQLFKFKEVCFAFPYRRKNSELEKLVARSFRVSSHAYARHQYPDPVVLQDGTRVDKPPGW